MNRKPWNLRALTLTLLWVLALVASPFASAQPLNVSGTVTDPTGEVLIGVSVSVKGDQKIATPTDYEGHYTLAGVPSDGTLVFSYVGFKAVEVAVAGRTRIDVTMHEDSEILDEVVVVGYGSLSRKELSSSIVQVNSADFQKGAMNSPMEMLTGKVAGLNVSSTASANPNAGADLQVRGATSLSAGNGPLIVIDGVPGGNLTNINANDIASFDILKDGAASAIYGTRGSNGVILVTTKKGQRDGAVHTSYTGTFAWDKANRDLKMLSAQEYRAVKLGWGDRGVDLGGNLDWFDAVTRTGFTQQHTLTVSGGNSNSNYRVSADFRDANGIDLRSGRREYGARASICLLYTSPSPRDA